jgi:eukaryotic-like serine/threonine-protein kinase
MTPEQYHLAREYFHEAVDLEPQEQARKLEEMPAEIREEVRRLLDLHAADRTFLDEPIFEPPRTLAPGETVGRFRVVRALGRGGMGEVFEAEDLKFSQRCAIKTVAPEWLDDRETVSRFERETKIGRELNHPNICRVYEYLEEPRGRHLLGLIVMEYIDGQTLEELVSRDGPLPLATASTVLSGILDGLAEAHRCGVIHRDLKPGNVMLQKDGRTVLMDFGLARHAAESSSTQRIRGTVSYMAPEQYQGESTFRSDIYSLGLVVHFMLTARRSESEDQIPRRWREAVRKCTAVVPSERYGSIAEVRAGFFPQAVWSRRAWMGAAAAAALAPLVIWKARRSELHVIAGTRLTMEPVENRTGDPALDALTQVIATQLEQSPRIRLVEGSGAHANSGLTLHVTVLGEREATGLEFALRSSSSAVTSHSVQAQTRADLFPAAYEACQWVRRTIGESAQDMGELNLRPEAATTSSWDALMAFTRAEREARAHHADAALMALGEALRLDSQFALASMRRGDILASLGRDGEALEAWRHTLQLAARQRLTRLEEFRIRSMFAADNWDFDNALQVYDAYVGYYPHDPDAWRFRAFPLIMLARGPQALESLRKSLEIEPQDAGTQADAGLFGSILGHAEWAREHLPAAARIRPAMAARIAQLVAFIEGRYGELDQWYGRARQQTSPEQQSVVDTQHAHLLAELGRWEESERILREGVDADLRRGLIAEANRKKMSLLAIRIRLYGWRRDGGSQDLADSLARSSGPWERMIAASALARAGAIGPARALEAGLREFPPTPICQYAVERVQGEIALMEGRIRAGLAHLEKAASFLPPAWPREFLAWAWERAGRPGAVAEYRRLAASKGILWVSVYLERPGIWADTLERCVSLDPGAAASWRTLLHQVRRKGDM